MAAHSTRIWVLITDGVSTRICSSHDGMATPITAPCFNLYGWDSDDRDVMAYKAWFKTERQARFSQSSRHQHVLHLSQLLLEAARERAYDGLVIVAAAPIVAQLEDVLAPESRALLVGRIIEDYVFADSDALCEQPDLRH